MNDAAFLAALTGEPLDAFAAGDAADARAAVDAIRGGLAMVAAELDAPAPAATRRRQGDRAWRVVAAAAVWLLIAAAVALLAARRHQEPASPSASPTPSPIVSGLVLGLPPDPGWQVRAAQADRIVSGTVTRVDRGGTLRVPPTGEGSDLPYLLVHVDVEEAIKGPASDMDVLAYDVTYEVVDEGAPRPWVVGQRVLLFLSSPEPGTPSVQVEVPHLDLD
ncbi:MAG TPA: hypothetical protein VFQ85_05670, partial [Mycobacteriales bacterium]|nr:hypothetical protein [Mycobacteriales bacterium]